MKLSLEALSIKDLTALDAKVAAAIKTAREREKAALREEMRAIAEARGLSLGEVLAVAGKIKKTRRRGNIVRMRDKVSGVVWAGAGRYPPNFVKSRAEIVR